MTSPCMSAKIPSGLRQNTQRELNRNDPKPKPKPKSRHGLQLELELGVGAGVGVGIETKTDQTLHLAYFLNNLAHKSFGAAAVAGCHTSSDSEQLLAPFPLLFLFSFPFPALHATS